MWGEETMTRVQTALWHRVAVGTFLIVTGVPVAKALLPPGARHRNEINAILESADLEKVVQSNPIDQIKWQSEGPDINRGHYLIEWQDRTHHRTGTCSVIAHIRYVFHAKGHGPRVDEGLATAKIDRGSLTCQ
jgi:GH25 family lysozyme M1 (1,4-beta-N-acetylmuramidase)